MGKKLLKWFGGAALAATFGYLVLGPKLAGDPKLKRLVQRGAEAVVPMGGGKNLDDEPVEEEAAAPEKVEGAPKVRVGVKPVDEAPRRGR